MRTSGQLKLELLTKLKLHTRRRRGEGKRKMMSNGHEIYFDGDSIYAVTPEGKCGSMPLELFFEKITTPAIDLSGVIPPKGVIREWSRGNAVIWLYERGPQLYNFKWIANDSAARFGRGAKYRDVRIMVPFLEIFAVFAVVPPGRLTLTSANEAFFRTKAVTAPEDELCFPALLNCSKFPVDSERPLSWICTQYLNRAFDREADLNGRMQGALKSLLRCMVDGAYNESSEHHEGASYFTLSRKVDERISTIEKWEAASKEDPNFVYEVPWLKTGFSVKQVVERIFKNLKATRPAIKTPADIARIILNQKPPPPPFNPFALL